MIDSAVIDRILKAGVLAPSGDNSQPWSFRLTEDTIIVTAHPEKDHAILNIAGRGTLLALGTLLENISVAARHEGYFADISLVSRDGMHARVSFRPIESKGHVHAQSLFERHTHRGPYHALVDSAALSAITNLPAGEHCTIKMITDKEALRTVAEAAVLMEETALSVHKLHRLFFASILWSREENERGASGLYIKTTELPAAVRGLFRVMRHWGAMKLFRAVGLHHMAARSNAALYTRAGALVAVILDRNEPEDYVAAGRTLERVWLETTRQGLSAQPLAGLLYLAQYLAANDDDDIPSLLRVRISEASARIQATVAPEGGTVVMLLRIGKALKPASARSKRAAPHVVWD